MQLTIEQLVSLRDGKPVLVSEPGVGPCVVIRADVFEQVCRPIDGETEADLAETYPAVLEAWDSMGSPDDAEDYRT